ncbi:glycosyltransferase [Bacillus timonensis]|nr:glycosyltransferase [Bacillus timonensis]
MKVLLIDVNYKYSSTGKIVHDLYTDLTNNGHQAAVCYGRGPLENAPNVYKFSSNAEVYAHALLTRVTGLTGKYSPLATRNLIKFMDEFKPDVVHIHELHAYFINIAPVLNYLKENKVKTIWTFHCEFMYTGKCGHAFDCEKWKTECGNCPQVREYPSSFFFDFTRKMFNEKKKLFNGFDNLTIVTPSYWLSGRVNESFLADKDVRVIHNGIDTTNTFYPRNFDHLKKLHNITDEKIVVAVAPDLMSEQKGGRWVKELAARFKDKRVKFILIGVDDLSEEFGDNIIALGRTKNQIELAEYYSMADLTILTSMKETFSLVCAESLACGTPIIGFDSGAPSEVAPKGYGMFVPYGDVDSLEKAVRVSFEETEIFNSKDECVNYSKHNYSKESMYNNYLDLYLKY